MNDKINIYDLSENRINQAIENLTKFHKDKMQTFSDSLDVNLGIALQLIENQKAEIEKKDKIIELLTEFIKNNMSEKKIINEVCIKGKCNNEECHEDDLKQCIKQYFEKKA